MIETSVVAAIIVGIIAIAVTVQLIEDWLSGRFRMDVREGELFPERMFAYGHFLEMWTDRPIGTYVYLRLRSYAWERDACRALYCWHERVLVRNPRNGHWSIQLCPVRDHT